MWPQEGRDTALPAASIKAGRDVIGKCKNAPLSACSSFYEVLAHAH